MSSMTIPSSVKGTISMSVSSAKLTQFPGNPILVSSFKSISFQCPSPFKLKFKTNPKPPHSLSSPSPSPSSFSVQPIEEFPPKLQEIIELFQAAQDPRAKYQQLMFYANKLSPLSHEFKTKDNKVEGCVSQVWVRAFLKDNVVYFEADSDSIMTKGLAALLVLGLSGSPVPEILKVSPDFITLLGLQQNLTPSRNNGFLNMFKLMQRKALLLGLEAENSEQGSNFLQSQLGADNLEKNVGHSASYGVESFNLEEVSGAQNSNSNNNTDVDMTEESRLGMRGERIRETLERELSPVELELEDISHQHAGHVGVKGSNGETHFNLRIVSNEFEGKSLVKRHRMIYSLLQDEMEQGLHALSIVAKTPAEVQERR